MSESAQLTDLNNQINVLNTFNQIDSDSTSSLTNGEKNKK